MPLVQTRGAASAQGFGEFAQVTAANYIEDMFSTYLYTGTSPTLQTITNNIDLSTKGGLVWVKARVTAYDNYLVDSARGNYKRLESNSTGAQFDGSGTSNGVALTTSGFTVSASNSQINLSGEPYVSWTFREQAKFFDIVTYTGNGVAGRQIAHNLGSTPGCILVKSTSSVEDWKVYHRALDGGTGNGVLRLNTTDADQGTVYGKFNWGNNTIYIAPTSTVFTVATDGSVNANGVTYVAYLFAHDAGGFGLTGTDNVISCGSFTTDGSGNATISLGYEPQLTLQKRTDAAGNWFISDVMRGMTVSAAANLLRPNLTDAESTGGTIAPTATGFTVSGYGASSTTIYIAIRRGPMKVPTLGTSVFSPVANTQSSGTVRTIGFPADLAVSTGRTTNLVRMFNDRLRGFSSTNTAFGPRLFSNDTSAESSSFTGVGAVTNTGYQDGDYFDPGISMIRYLFARAPSFFDEVCYTADSVNGRTINHNLTVAPEFTIFKSRSATSQWYIWHSAFTLSEEIYFNTNAVQAGGIFTSSPTSSAVFVSSSNINFSSLGNVVGYLFATCAGVSKVGSYTGNGTTQTINCGFGAGGARFVLIKRTDATGDWYVYDTARGMTVLTDPYLWLNSANAEVATLGSVTTVSTGFALNSTILAAINVNAGTYIFLAIA